MKKLTDLKFLFKVVAILEFCYFITALTPPSLITAVTGWVLNADGQWLAKLIAMALGSQAWVAWELRHKPHLGIAKALAAYQLASASVDWIMWLVMSDEGIFSTITSKVLVSASIGIHHTLGILLILGIQNESKARREASAGGHVAPT